jgi:glutathione synthase/RimK-type ligase-like ATP-grasp enzyme
MRALMTPPRPSIALVSARVARSVDEDFRPLEQALISAGADVSCVDWDDPSADWSGFDLAVLRATWDYTLRLEEFMAWARTASSHTQLVNPLPYLQWNCDKHYMSDLAGSGVPVIPGHFIEPGTRFGERAEEFIAGLTTREGVVKPAVGAGSRDAQRHDCANIDAIREHAQRLADSGRSALIQPYLASVDERGETALIFYAGQLSHAICKGPLLKRGGAAEQGLFARETITPRVPSEDEKRVAQRALAAIPFGMPLYARVDLIEDAQGAPQVLELELIEPSMFFAHAPAAAARFADVLVKAASQREVRDSR